MHPDMDTSEIIQAFIEKPTYDSSNRIPSKATPELLEAVEKCLQLNRNKRLMGMQKQTMRKIDIHAYLKEQGFDVSYSTVKRASELVVTGEVKGIHAFFENDRVISHYEFPNEIADLISEYKDWGNV